MARKQSVGEHVPVADLVPWDRNPRRNDLAVKAVADSIAEFGFAAPILARKKTKVVIAGHTRLKAAKSLGLETVPVVFLDLTESQAKRLALADNRLGEIASWDEEELRDILTDLDDEGADLSVLGWTGADIDKLFADDDAAIREWEAGDLHSDQQIVVLLHVSFDEAARLREMFEKAGYPYDLHLRFSDGGAEP